MQQANRVGYHPVWIGYETMDDPSVTANGGSEANGAIMAADYNPALNTPQNVAFKKAYTAATKQQPSNYAALGYQSIINIATAIKAIPGTVTRDNLAAALATIKATSIVSGGVPFQFASNRLAADPAAVITIANGKFVLLK
jgi:branched-chain amino acid transport system substrate-binding protein